MNIFYQFVPSGVVCGDVLTSTDSMLTGTDMYHWECISVLITPVSTYLLFLVFPTWYLTFLLWHCWWGLQSISEDPLLPLSLRSSICSRTITQVLVRHQLMCCWSFLSTVCNTSVMESLTSIVADFHGLISNSFPNIIDLLPDNSDSVRWASVKVQSKLSKHGM